MNSDILDKLSMFEYSLFTGKFYKKGTAIVACSKMSIGYRRIRWSQNNKSHTVYGHQAAWWILTGTWPAPKTVDHVNRCRSDNSFLNLRLCNGASEQGLNVPTRSNTGLKNIVHYRRLNRSEYFGCFIKHNGKRYTKHSIDIRKVFSWRNQKRLELFGPEFSWPSDQEDALLKYGLKD
jgi:hypothetical protein